MSDKKIKKSFRERFGLPMALTIISMACIIGISSIIGFHALQVVYQQKLRDTWAILFLDLEQSASRTQAIFNKFDRDSVGPEQVAINAPVNLRMPDLVFRLGGKDKLSPVRGEFAKTLDLKELGIKADIGQSRIMLTDIGGSTYMVRTAKSKGGSIYGINVTPGTYFFLWNLPTNQWLKDLTSQGGETITYIATKQGKLLYSNSPIVTAPTILSRPLVQSFVAAPFSQGQIEFNDEKRGASFGFYHEVPETNVVLFSETTKKFALTTVQNIVMGFGGFAILLLIGAVFILQFPLQYTVQPLKDLARIAKEVSLGNFHAVPRYTGIGEIYTLTESFRVMSKNLIARDERIMAFTKEQAEKVRLENEVAIARTIQGKLLPRKSLSKESGLDVATRYQPANEVAGDWFTHYYDEKTGESIFALADVTGHGAGAAMLTAVIATAFGERIKNGLEGISIQTLLSEINDLVFKVGEGQWGATMVVSKYNKHRREIEFANAGHEFPIVVDANGTIVKQPSQLASPALGNAESFVPHLSTIKLEKAATVFLYTDGLIHRSTSGSGQLFGRKRLAKVLQSSKSVNAGDTADKLILDWKASLGSGSQIDDLCLLVIKAS